MFNPNKIREQLSSSYGIKSYSNYPLEGIREQNALAGYGRGMLQDGIRCFLVGYFESGHALLQKGSQFLQAAVDGNEIPLRYSRGGAESHRLQDLALCNWLVDGTNDLAMLKAAINWREIWLAALRKVMKIEIQLTLPRYLEAQEYIKLIERYEQAGLKKPSNLRRIQGQGTMCYAIARQRLGLEYTAEEVADGLERFLKRRVPIWLGPDGNYDGVALWMKIAHWRPGDDPIATLLRCYTYLDGLTPPTYPSAEDTNGL